MKLLVVDGVKVVDERRVSPPVGSVPATELCLNYFDIAMLSVQVEYLFFFDFPGSTQDFRDVHFPRLKRSLSLALSLFYPLAGRVVPSPESPNYYPGGDRVIRYSDGDSVSLTLAESGNDFASLVGNQAKEAKAFHPLVPPLPRVTVFPGSGVSVGLTFNHVVSDGTGIIHFIKSWAAISKAGGGDVSVVKDLPSFDRASRGDLEPLKRAFLEKIATDHRIERLAASSSESKEEPNQTTRHGRRRMTRATFVLKRAHIEALRSSNKIKISSFSAACALVWSCLAKSRPTPPRRGDGESYGTHCFWLPANHRHRLRPPLGRACFGNFSPVVSHAELAGENGFSSASEAIQSAIRRIDEGRVDHL
ncbi:hypothetical protein H6P81_011118 [Aristolochia fimbriata]|uniref:Uncharacterized protein n=1 Tax=Aristolochia fimbriata TaxID=158543 RepID=A0AAV7EQY0_ARIFI|nr:hypothetical protein H6P81_011118 [Aristolochia fimbriata]